MLDQLVERTPGPAGEGLQVTLSVDEAVQASHRTNDAVYYRHWSHLLLLHSVPMALLMSNTQNLPQSNA